MGPVATVKGYTINVVAVHMGGQGRVVVNVEGPIREDAVEDIRNFVRGYAATFGVPRPTIEFVSIGRRAAA